jgi:hypothetical protein
MSDEEMEEFGINDQDYERMFNPSSRRNKMSKEEAMLGIWASSRNGDSSDENGDDDDEFSYKNQSKNSKTINFVTSKSFKKPIDMKQKEQNESDSNGKKGLEDDKISDDEYDFENKKGKKVTIKSKLELILKHLNNNFFST